MDVGGWFEANSGGFGISESIGNEMKYLLSSQNVASHVILISAGIIPSIVANNVKLGVERFAKFDPQASMETIATIQNATVADQSTVKAGADTARTGQQMVVLKAGEIKAALSALAEVDDGSNKILDINSMMTALKDYIKKVSEGKAGVPINYYLKDITREMLAQLWVSKYFPDKYIDENSESKSISGSKSKSGTDSTPVPNTNKSKTKSSDPGD